MTKFNKPNTKTTVITTNLANRLFIMVMAVISAITIVASCNTRTSQTGECDVDTNVEMDVDYEDLLDASEEMHGSICFDPYPEPEYWIAANLDELLYSDTTILSVDVDFGPDAGTGSVSLEAYPDTTFHAIFTRDGKRYDLFKEIDPDFDFDCFMATIAAIDLNHDGNKELILHTGDFFELYAFAVHTGKNPLKYAGSLTSNFGFFVTDNGTIVSRIGSQGGALFAKYEDEQLAITDEDVWFDKCLMASPGFHNLEYDFPDTSDKDRTERPLLKTEKYIISNANNLYGDHTLRIDLDSDGEEEQLYMSRPGWGATSCDIAQVNERYRSYGLIGEIIENEDTIAMDFKNFDIFFNGKVQLSAVDVNKDGVYEVLLTVGEKRLNSTYIYSYKKGEGVALIKHIVHKGELKDSDLIMHTE